MGLPLENIQKAQNMMAREFMDAPWNTPLFHMLHLLLVCFQMEFKVLVVIYKALHTMELFMRQSISQEFLPME